MRQYGKEMLSRDDLELGGLVRHLEQVVLLCKLGRKERYAQVRRSELHGSLPTYESKAWGRYPD